MTRALAPGALLRDTSGLRRLRITLPGAAGELADFFADLGALEVRREPDRASATFSDAQPEGLEDRVELFLHLVDRPGTLARVETARGDGPWLEGWRGVFAGSDAGRFRIRPPWAEPPREGVPIIVDPRGAFGSGLHPSTRLSLALMERRLARGRSFLDVGAGSGVLSVAAALSGLRACACELEPAAREACRRTAAMNGVSFEVLDDLPARSFDLVAANMPASTLVALAPRLRQAVAPGGALIVSGARREQLDSVLLALGAPAEGGARLDSPDGQWSAFLL